MISTDSRFENALGDIWQHRVNNYDWDDNWVFSDHRFKLKNGSDSLLLNFLCEIFHPVVRDDSKPWKKIFDIINELIKKDGYEFYEKDHISGRSIYGWKETESQMITLKSEIVTRNFELKLIGEGSYAHVFKLYDDFYNKSFALKRAKKILMKKK